VCLSATPVYNLSPPPPSREFPPHISDQSRTIAPQVVARSHARRYYQAASRRSTACPRMLTVRLTPLPPIHCTSWIMHTLYLFSSGVLLWGSAARVWGHCHAGSPPRHRRCDLGEATSEKRPRRCDLVCTSAPARHSACILLSHADDASPEDLCPPRRPVPCSGTTAPRSRSDFRFNLANEIQSRLATSHRSAGGRRAHLPY
jgi:hypothetical protein